MPRDRDQVTPAEPEDAARLRLKEETGRLDRVVPSEDAVARSDRPDIELPEDQS